MTPPPQRPRFAKATPGKHLGRAKGRFKPRKDRPGSGQQRASIGPGNRPSFRPKRPGGRPSVRPSRPQVSRRNPDEISPSRLEAAKALYSMEKGAKVADAMANHK